MTDKHKQLRDALADGNQTISHVAVADHYELRWMTGRKMPDGMSYVDLHSAPSGRRVHGCIAADPEAIRALLADHDALKADNERLRTGLKNLIRGYVNTLEFARERIKDFGGDCDPVSVMEARDPHLRAARAALTQGEQNADQ